MKLVAVTSCPTGIAHTYMAAESIEQAAKAAGHKITVETQGAAGADPIPADVIAAADAVIFAADVEVRDRERFAGKPLVIAPVKRAINDGPGLVAEAVQAAESPAPLAAAAGRPVPAGSAAAGLVTKVDQTAGFGTRLRQWLMTGVSYMIPFVAAGGILIAISFIWGGPQVASKVFGGTFHGHTYPAAVTGIEGFTVAPVLHAAGYAGLLFLIGKVAFFMLVPMLAGFIAFAMADRMALVPGFVGRPGRHGDRRRLPGRPDRRPAGGRHRHGAEADQGPAGPGRHHAGRGDTAAVGGRDRRDHGRGGRTPDRRRHHRHDQLAARPVRYQRRDPGPAARR